MCIARSTEVVSSSETPASSGPIAGAACARNDGSSVRPGVWMAMTPDDPPHRLKGWGATVGIAASVRRGRGAALGSGGLPASGSHASWSAGAVRDGTYAAFGRVFGGTFSGSPQPTRIHPAARHPTGPQARSRVARAGTMGSGTSRSFHVIPPSTVSMPRRDAVQPRPHRPDTKTSLAARM